MASSSSSLFSVTISQREVFSIGNRLFHKAKMRVVRRRDINDIDLRIGKHLMEIIVNFSNSIFLRKSSRLLMGPVADRVNILSVFCSATAISFAITPHPSTAHLISFIVRFSYRIYFAQSGSSLPL